MALPKSLTTVTPFSKMIALVLFIAFPFAAFIFGMQYQKMITPQYPPTHYEPLPTTSLTPTSSASPSCKPRPACLDTNPRCLIPETPDMCPKASSPETGPCTMEAKECPDGSYVGRQGPKCQFAACPKVKKETCPCWDAVKNTCLPQSACQ